MKKTGLAMYTVHRAVEQNMTETFRKLYGMGYRGIEFFGEPENFPAEAVRGALAESGLAITGWHLDWKRFHDEAFYETVTHLQKIGCGTAIVQCLGGKWNIGHNMDQECKERWLFYIDWMNQVQERIKKEGMKLGYHNHEHEFALRYDGRTVFDLLFENLDPDIIMELDSGNCIEGGGSPLKVLEKYKDRQVLLHLKPYSHSKGFDVVLGEETDANDWNAILHHPWKEFEWLLVESENTVLPELENAGRCMENLKKYFND